MKIPCGETEETTARAAESEGRRLRLDRRRHRDGRLPPLMSPAAAERAAVRESTSRASASATNKYQQQTGRSGGSSCGVSQDNYSQGLHTLFKDWTPLPSRRGRGVHVPAGATSPFAAVWRCEGKVTPFAPCHAHFSWLPSVSRPRPEGPLTRALSTGGAAARTSDTRPQTAWMQTCHFTSQRHSRTCFPPPPLLPPVKSL